MSCVLHPLHNILYSYSRADLLSSLPSLFPFYFASQGPSLRAVPWRSLAKSRPVWAIVVAHFCNNWGFYTLLACLPTFIHQTLGFDLETVSLPLFCIDSKQWMWRLQSLAMIQCNFVGPQTLKFLKIFPSLSLSLSLSIAALFYVILCVAYCF